MKICNLRNDHLLSRYVYSDILNRKFKKKIPFPQENLDWAECVMLSLQYKVQRRFWATDSNRKQGLFPHCRPWRHHICIDECHYSYRDDLPENLDKTTAQECKTFTSGGHWPPCLNRKRHLIFKRSDKIHHCKYGAPTVKILFTLCYHFFLVI